MSAANSFRAVDAFEYVDAFRWAFEKPEGEVRTRMRDLNERMAQLEKDGIPSYLLAAYRGYENALSQRATGTAIALVVVDDARPA